MNRITCLDLYQRPHSSRTVAIFSILRGEFLHNYYVKTPLRYARVLHMVIAYAAITEKSMVQDA